MSGAFNAYIQCKANKTDSTPISRTGGYIAGDAAFNLTLFIPKGCWYSCNYSYNLYRRLFFVLEELCMPLCRILIAAFVSASISSPQLQL